MRRQIAPFQTWADSRLLPLIYLLGLMLLTQPLQAAAEVLPATNCNAGRHTGIVEPLYSEATTAVLERVAADAVEDVVIGPDGLVRGRVAAGPATKGAQPLRVRFVLGRRTVAVTATDPEGRFAARNLSGGLYRVVVEGPDRSNWRYCRLWPATIAPPCARALVTLPAGEPIVRGQRPLPFPIMSLRQAATVTGVVGGAIAVPLIYHNARSENRVPASR